MSRAGNRAPNCWGKIPPTPALSLSFTVTFTRDHPPSCSLSTCRESMQYALTFPLYPSPPEYLTPSPPHIPCLASLSHALSVVSAAWEELCPNNSKREAAPHSPNISPSLFLFLTRLPPVKKTNHGIARLLGFQNQMKIPAPGGGEDLLLHLEKIQTTVMIPKERGSDLTVPHYPLKWW